MMGLHRYFHSLLDPQVVTPANTVPASQVLQIPSGQVMVIHTCRETKKN